MKTYTHNEILECVLGRQLSDEETIKLDEIRQSLTREDYYYGIDYEVAINRQFYTYLGLTFDEIERDFKARLEERRSDELQR
jgi:hypothetical protein